MKASDLAEALSSLILLCDSDEKLRWPRKECQERRKRVRELCDVLKALGPAIIPKIAPGKNLLQCSGYLKIYSKGREFDVSTTLLGGALALDNFLGANHFFLKDSPELAFIHVAPKE